MKLSSLYDTNSMALNECIEYAKTALGPKTICESATIDNIAEKVKNNLVERINKATQFGQLAWIDDLINGLKQAGIHGINEIEDRPVTISEIKKIVSLIIDIAKIR